MPFVRHWGIGTLLPLVILSCVQLHRSLTGIEESSSSPTTANLSSNGDYLDPIQLMKEGYLCFSSGDCMECTLEEMGQSFCQTTRRRQEITCEKEEDATEIDEGGIEQTVKKLHAHTTYETCYHTSSDDMSSVLRFQAAMAIVGGLALYGVRHQKLKHQTLYEKRRLTTRGRGGGGGGTIYSNM